MKTKPEPTPEQMNDRRINAAWRALESFADSSEGESWRDYNPTTTNELQEQNLCDLLADFAHLCDNKGWTLADCLRRARNSYNEETEGNGTQFPASPPPDAAPPAPLSVVVEITGGCTDVTACPGNVAVRIVDWDMFDSGDHTLTGENAVSEEYRAWLEANRPDWYAEQLIREKAIDAERAASTGIECKAGELCLDCGMAHPPGQHLTADDAPASDGKAAWEKNQPPLTDEQIKARAGLLPSDPADDAPDEDGPFNCSQDGCTTMVNREDPYFATPCGTYCSVHMRAHMKDCDICRAEFTD